MAHETVGGGGADPESRRFLPLNSKRLMGPLLKRIAVGLEVPVTASLDDIRQLVEGKLGEFNRDPRNVQVSLCDVPGEVKIELWDAGGAFLELEPSSPQEEESDTWHRGYRDQEGGSSRALRR